MVENKSSLYQMRCPDHPKQKIGVARFGDDHKFDQGHYCPKCDKYILFNEMQFGKYLTSGLFFEINNKK